MAERWKFGVAERQINFRRGAARVKPFKGRSSYAGNFRPGGSSFARGSTRWKKRMKRDARKLGYRVNPAKRAKKSGVQFYANGKPVANPGCQWFAMCRNDAVKLRPHPILGQVPICQRCDDKVAAIGGEVKKNPRKRRKFLSVAGKHRRLARMESGRAFHAPGVFRGAGPGMTRRRLARRAQIRPPVRGLTVQRVPGVKRVRKNPTARRASFVVSYQIRNPYVKSHVFASPKYWTQAAAFVGKEQALDYARALHRSNPNAAVKVEKRR